MLAAFQSANLILWTLQISRPESRKALVIVALVDALPIHFAAVYLVDQCRLQQRLDPVSYTHLDRE